MLAVRISADQNGSEPAPTRDAMRRVFARVAGFAAIASATAPEATDDDAAVTARVADRLTAERELFG